MRRLVFSIIVAAGLVVIGAGSASAEQAPTAGSTTAVPGKKVCKVTDPKLDELSGIVATKSGFIVIDDSTPLADHKRIFYLNNACAITRSVRYGGNGPRDTEDMVLSPDGKTLWIADIGDNDRTRATIGLWSMPVDGSSSPTIHRLSYPDGRHDAEALLLGGDGTPIIVTKEVGKPAGVYTPTGPLKTDNTVGVALKNVGQITVPPSDTSANAFSRLGRGTIDGAAIAPGGGRVVLRTYTDALEWTVTGGDVLAAIQGTPRVTPLPDEQLGEAITYSPDGKYFYTVSDMQGQPQSGDDYILRYTPVAKVVTTAAAKGSSAKSGPSWFSNLSLSDITYFVIGVGVLGALLVGLGLFGIMRARKRGPLEPTAPGVAGSGPRPLDAQTEFVGLPANPRDQRSGVYGGGSGAQSGGAQSGGAQSGGVYGSRPSGPAPGSGVYGGAPAGGRPGADPAGRPGAGAGRGVAGRSGTGGPAGSDPGAGRSGAGGRSGSRGIDRPGQGATDRPGRGGGGWPGQGDQPGGRPGFDGRPASGVRPGQGGGRPAGGGGVYGSPPPEPAPPERNASTGSSYRQGGSYVDVNGSRGRGDYDNPNYRRTPYGG